MHCDKMEIFDFYPGWPSARIYPGQSFISDPCPVRLTIIYWDVPNFLAKNIRMCPIFLGNSMVTLFLSRIILGFGYDSYFADKIDLRTKDSLRKCWLNH